ncbi:MAG: hypothetical protein C0592_00560, partial [Marinilabiliales bacterium]
MFMSPGANAQSGLCDPGVPFYTCDLTGQPNGTWVSPPDVRTGFCCGAVNPDRCIEFEITLDPGTVAINFDIASGAVPPGAMFYQINCGPPVPVGTPICLSGAGPHTLTFCKPGNNPNTYAITAIGAPEVSPPVYASSSCPAEIWVSGLDSTTVTWTDLTGGGAYLSYLSCTSGCLSPTVTPAPGHPSYVDYLVCGEILAGACVSEDIWCDTIRVYMFDPIDAMVNPNPASYCQGESGVDLFGSATGGFGSIYYNWYDNTWTNVGSTQNYFASSPGIYYLVVTDDMYPGCPADTVEVVVTELPPPTITIDPSYVGVCEGATVDLTASGAQTYVWSPATGLSGTTGATVTASPTSTTTYTVTGTDANGCTNTAFVLFEIFPLPVIDAGPDQAICLGDTAQLQGSGAFIYDWTPGATLSDTTIANPLAFPTVTTTYYLTGYSVGGQTITNGDFEAGNMGFYTDYLYDPDLYPEGNYYITDNPNTHHANFAACQDHTPAPGTQMMVVNGAPNPGEHVWCQDVAVSPNTDYIFSTWITSVHPTNPAVLQFSINSSLLGTPFTAPTTTCTWMQFYEVWNSGIATTAQICIVNQNIIRNGNDFALDDISFSPLCSDIDSVTVTVNPNPILTINSTSTEICDSASATLTVSSDIPGTTYLWSTGETTPNITVSPNTTTTYTVTGTSPDGCTGTAEIEITVNPLPLLTLTTSNTEICDGQIVTIQVTPDISGCTYLWSTGATTPDVVVMPSSSTTYGVTVTSPDGCISTATVPVTVYPLPNLTVSASTTVICDGEDAILSVTSDIPGTTFLWSTGETTPNITVSPSGTTTYTVTGTSPEGCISFSVAIITVNPVPIVTAAASDPEICVGEMVTVNATSDLTVSTFLWSTGATSSGILVNPTSTTNYGVTVTSPEGCTNT